MLKHERIRISTVGEEAFRPKFVTGAYSKHAIIIIFSRPYSTVVLMRQACVCRLLSVTLCIAARRCVLVIEQKVL